MNATELGISINEDEDEGTGSNNALIDNALVNAKPADTNGDEGEEEEDEVEDTPKED